MPRVRIVLLYVEGEILAREQLILWDAAVVALPVVGQELPARDPDLPQQPFQRGIRTWTDFPGEVSPRKWIMGLPNPNLVFFPLTKCHISSICTISVSAGTSGSRSVSASPRIQR